MLAGDSPPYLDDVRISRRETGVSRGGQVRRNVLQQEGRWSEPEARTAPPPDRGEDDTGGAAVGAGRCCREQPGHRFGMLLFSG